MSRLGAAMPARAAGTGFARVGHSCTMTGAPAGTLGPGCVAEQTGRRDARYGHALLVSGL